MFTIIVALCFVILSSLVTFAVKKFNSNRLARINDAVWFALFFTVIIYTAVSGVGFFFACLLIGAAIEHVRRQVADKTKSNDPVVA